jgi:hypothetical protein
MMKWNRMWMESLLGNLNLLYWHSSNSTKEDHEKRKEGWSVSPAKNLNCFFWIVGVFFYFALVFI